MIVDGKHIADTIYDSLRTRVKECKKKPKAVVITCAPNFETQKYLNLKKKKAEEVGVELEIVEETESSTTDDFITRIQDSAKTADSIIVQLPLPPSIDRDSVFEAIPPDYDADALNPNTKHVLAPVVGAIQQILSYHEILPTKKYVTIIGNGKLVGLPAYKWFVEEGAYVTLVTKDVVDITEHTKSADIVVCGAGVAGLLIPSMVKEGVIILDAGTSEDGGELRGDASPLCAEKASLFTPVPGGIGPITIAMLLSNVVDCHCKRSDVV